VADLARLELAIESPRLAHVMRKERSRDAEQAKEFRQIAITGFLETYENLGKAYADLVPADVKLASRRCLGLDGLPDRGWHWDLFHRNKIARVLMKFGPLERAELLDDAAYQALRGHWEKRDAKMRKPSGGFIDLDNLTTRALDETILDSDGASAGYSTPETEIIDKEIQAEKNERRVRIIALIKQLPPRQRAVWEALLAGKPHAEAAKAGNVTERMVRKYKMTVRAQVKTAPNQPR
jgi:Sigma-70, region 4